MFDLKDFYPSIWESLLCKALQFAKAQINNAEKDIELDMFHSRKSLSYNKKKKRFQYYYRSLWWIHVAINEKKYVISDY